LCAIILVKEFSVTCSHHRLIILRACLKTIKDYMLHVEKCALARQNSGGAAGECVEALFCIDFSFFI